MATDLFKQVLWNNGEGITHTDLNNMQGYLSSLVTDGFLSCMTPNLGIDTLTKDLEFGSQSTAGTGMPWGAAALARAYTLAPGQAFLRQGSANHKIQISAGTLLQILSTGTLTGDAPVFIPFRFDGTSTGEFTLTAGDATNPRVDLLQMKLEYLDGGSVSRDFEDATTRIVTSTAMNKTRRIQCTLSVKAGTPAASPTCPEPDAGFCVVGSVMVGNTWAIAGTAPIFGEDTIAAANLVVHDQRMPLRVRAYYADPSTYKLVTAWALSNNGSSVTSSSATNLMYVPCPAGLGRLVGVGVFRSGGIVVGSDLGRSSNIISTSYVTRNNILGLAGNYTVSPFHSIENLHLPDAGPTILQSATSKIGVPLWTNGKRSPFEHVRVGTPGAVTIDRLVLRVQSTASGSIVSSVVFYVADGI